MKNFHTNVNMKDSLLKMIKCVTCMYNILELIPIPLSRKLKIYFLKL